LRRVDLTEVEKKVVMMVAREKYEYSREHHVEMKRMEDGLQADIDGMIGEVCFGKMFNYFVNLSARKADADFYTKDGKSIDVKSTRYKTGRLVATINKKRSPCDLYVLMVIDDEGGWYKGYVSKEELFRDENIKDLGHGPTYVYEIR